MFAMMMVVGFVFMILPVIGPVFIKSFELSTGAKSVLMIFGVAVFVIGALLSVITRLYVKANADLAWVRTGMGGQKAILNGGTIAVPFAHSMTPVSLQTMKLEVDRTGKEALLTEDKLRADVKAEFYIRIKKDESSVLNAAASLGERCSDPTAVKDLMMEKLVSALRSVAATKSLGDLNSKREDFAKAVQEIVGKELEPNGLWLETVTISHLDQTPPDAMNPEGNVFDAEGRRTIAQITQKYKVERTQIEQEATKKTIDLETGTQQYVFAKQVEQTKAKASTDAEKAKAQADATALSQKAQAEASAQAQKAKAAAEAEAAVFASEQTRKSGEAAAVSQQAVDIAQVAAARQVEIATVEKDQVVAIARQKSEQASREAEIAKNRAVEVSTREQQIAVAQKEAERATAEAGRLEAEKTRETAAQQVKTVEAVQTAERDAQKAVIAKKAVAQQTQIEQQMAADVAAYTTTKQAEAGAQAAEKQAAAQLRLADAAKQSAVLHAEGAKAEGLVPVQVAEQQVAVEAKRVEVLKSELAAKSANQEIAIQLQVELAKIEANRAAMIAQATAIGQMFAKADFKVFGDPMVLARMVHSFNQGMSAGTVLEGAKLATPEGVKDSLTELFEALSTRLAGKAPTLENLQAILPSIIPLLPKSDAEVKK